MYLGEQSRLNCSDETAARVDKEIHRVMTECYNRAVQLLTENKDKLDLLAGVLYEKENITGEEFMALLGGKSVEEVFGAAEEPVAEENITDETSTEEVVAESLTEENTEENSTESTSEDVTTGTSDETEGNE